MSFCCRRRRNSSEEEVMVPVSDALTVTSFSSSSPTLHWHIEKAHRFGVLFSEQRQDGYCNHSITEFMINKIFGFTAPQILIHPSAVQVSVATDNFLVGRTPTDFLPTRGNLDGYLTFQKITRHVTATYYNVSDRQYLAGLTYFLGNSPQEQSVDTTSFELTWMIRRRFPDEHVIHDEPIYGRDCMMSGKRVLVGCHEENRILLHYNWNWKTGKFETEYCVECEARQMETSSTAVASHLGIILRAYTPEVPSIVVSPADTLEDASELTQTDFTDFCSSFSQLETEEVE